VQPFSRTRRFLASQRLRQRALLVGVLAGSFAAWAAWLKRGSVSLYVASREARLEVAGLPVAVQAPVDGLVMAADVRLGRAVRPGDVLVKLDARGLELQRAELEATIGAGLVSLRALRAQASAEQASRDAVGAAALQSELAAGARLSLDEKGLDYKAREAAMVGRLREASLASELEALRSAAETETQRARVAATSAQASLERRTGAVGLRDRDARLAATLVDVARAEADLATQRARRETLDHEIERRTVRAPVAGVLADVLPVSAGATLTSQQRLATILPEGPVRIVAWFAPEESLGRVRVGQPATLRVDNFPWTQFGTVGAVVEQMGREPRGGAVRVELAITRPNAAIPTEHGLTTGCEVEVERTTPLRLLLRAAGQAIPTPQPLAVVPATGGRAEAAP
jgi:multidrug resistance efflux pump